MDVVEIFDDRERLSQDFTARQFQRWHARLRIDGAKFGRVLASAIFGKVNRRHLIGKFLEIERDSDPIGGGRAKIRIEFHGTTPAYVAAAI